jgi:hypothetical protein
MEHGASIGYVRFYINLSPKKEVADRTDSGLLFVLLSTVSEVQNQFPHFSLRRRKK